MFMDTWDVTSKIAVVDPFNNNVVSFAYIKRLQEFPAFVDATRRKKDKEQY